MKILFCIDTLATGGKERRLTELLKALAVLPGHELMLLVMSKNIHFREVLELGVDVRFVIRKSRRDLSVFTRLYQTVKNFRPDIVHCWDSMTAVYAAPVCKLLGSRLVNGMVIDSPLQQIIFNKYWLRARLTFPFSDAVVCNSRAGLDAYKAPADRSYVIYNGFDFNRIDKLTPAGEIRRKLNIDGGMVVGMVATFSGYKDYPTYFKAAQLLLAERRDVTFLAIGTGTDSVKAQELIQPAYLDNFRLLGQISGTEEFINIMDVCVLSTITEGISNSILEYMALGKPVAATRGGGTAEIVRDGESGVLINRYDSEMLADRIKILLDDPELRDRLGLAGAGIVREQFSIEIMVDKYMSLYRALLKK